MNTINNVSLNRFFDALTTYFQKVKNQPNWISQVLNWLKPHQERNSIPLISRVEILPQTNGSNVAEVATPILFPEKQKEDISSAEESSIKSVIDLTQVLPIDPDVKISKLNNGFTYYIHPNEFPAKQRAVLRLAIKAGSLNETEEQRGLAHFLEHVAGSNTLHFPNNKITNYLDSKGVLFGPHNNAHTKFRETEFMINIPLAEKELLEKTIYMLSDIASNATFTNEVVNKEREAILDESRIAQGANRRYYERLLPVLLEGTRYPQRLPIGLMEVVKKATPDEIQSFYKEWYRPDNMALVVVGDINVQETESLIKQYFDKIPPSEKPLEFLSETITSHQETQFVCLSDREATQTSVSILFRLGEFKDDSDNNATLKDIRNSVTNALFHKMFNMRLSEITMDDQAPFSNADSSRHALFNFLPLYELAADVKEDRIFDTVKKLLVEFKRIKEHGFLPEEFDYAKTKQMSIYEHLEQESQTTHNQLADKYVSHFIDNGIAVSDGELVAAKKLMLQTLTLDEVNAWHNHLQTNGNCIIATLQPEVEGVKPVTPQDLQLACLEAENNSVETYKYIKVERKLMDEEPQPGKIMSKIRYEAIGVTEYILENGLKVIFKPTQFSNDAILLNSVAVGGDLMAPLEDHVSAKLADEFFSRSGIAGFSPLELMKVFNESNISLKLEISPSFRKLQTVSGKKDLETVFQLYHQIFMKPGHRPEAYVKTLNEVREDLIHCKSDPDVAFAEAIISINTQNHPAKKRISLEDLQKASFEKTSAFLRYCFEDPSEFSVTLVGNLDDEIVEPLLKKYLASIAKPNSREFEKEKPVITFPEGIVKWDVYAGQESACQIRLSFPTVISDQRKDRFMADWVTRVINKRLTDVIRMEQGASYSPSCFFKQLAAPGISQQDTAVTFVHLTSDEEKSENVINSTLSILKDLQEKGPSEEELESIKQFLKEAIRLRFQSNKGWCETLAACAVWGWDYNILKSELEEGIDSMTVESVRQILINLYDLNHYTQVRLFSKKGA